MVGRLWLKSKYYDLVFFQLGWLVLLPLVLPYYHFGLNYVFLLYPMQFIFFSFPHIILTIVSIRPATGDTNLNKIPVYICIAVAAVASLIAAWAKDSTTRLLISSIIIYASFWHTIRQHQGICRFYDAIHANENKDQKLYSDGAITTYFIALGFCFPILWQFTFPPGQIAISPTHTERLVRLQVPLAAFYIYAIMFALVGAIFIKRLIWDRLFCAEFVPWPQIILAIGAVFMNNLLYLILPPEAFALNIALVTTWHNIQYFGFVWLYEVSRPGPAGGLSAKVHNLIKTGNWRRLALLLLAGSLAFGFAVSLITEYMMYIVIGFVTLSHYLIDGFIWKKKYNRNIPAFVQAIVKNHAQSNLRIKTDPFEA